MNEHERNELFAALAELARRYPQWRVGQLVANLAGWSDAEVWDAEDSQLLAAARAHLGMAVEPIATPATKTTEDVTEVV
jgi:hypothetical protein